jgi:hypothetical protein
MWGKKEQTVMWATAYLPLYLIMIYRFIDSNDFFKKTNFALWLAVHINKFIFDTTIIILIIIFSLVMYRVVVNWYFKALEREVSEGNTGSSYSIRNYEQLSANDYSFFLMTLLLPLISLEYSSVINLIVSLLVISLIIMIFVKTDTVSVCPLFFTSRYFVFKAVISQNTKEEEALNPRLRITTIIITKQKRLNLNNRFKAEKLLNGMYYLDNDMRNNNE